MKRYWRDGRQAAALWELLVLVIPLGALLVLLWCRGPGVRPHESPVRTRCRNNLNQLAKGMALYLAEFGDGRFYPCPLGRGRDPQDYSGAEWLASLYWVGIINDPRVYLCPASGDDNDDGEELGAARASAEFGPETVSYAGLHYYSLTDEKGNPIRSAIRRGDLPSSDVMGCDDTEGRVNHGTAANGAMHVLFVDLHVEFKTNTELDLERAVGQKGGLLEKLRN